MTPGSVGELLSRDGPFAGMLDGFRSRPQQQAMAGAVEQVLHAFGTLVVEAGTGVGKTFAYLVPVLRSGRKVIVSTGTRHLQDQLYHKDLPVVRQALDVPVKTALLKGRSNYLCRYRLDRALDEGGGGASRGQLQRVAGWAGLTRTGDVAELAEIPEQSEVWPQVTSTVDNCLGPDCGQYSECWVIRARRAAQEADVVVINHHLLFADLALREEGFGELLPDADAFVLDEAHQLPELASTFFSTTVSSRQLQDLAQDVVAEQVGDAPDSPRLRELADAVRTAAMDLRLTLGEAGRRAPWSSVEGRPQVAAAMEALQQNLETLSAALEEVAERSKGLHNCHQRALAMAGRLTALRAGAQDEVQWFETYRRGFALHNTPLQVADSFRTHRERFHAAWVFTSATLTVGGRFDHFVDRLGLEPDTRLALDSPFDYASNALLLLPESMPDPGDRRHTRAVVEVALPLLRANAGRGFVLFTSYRALRDAAEMLEGRLGFPLLVQGSAPRRELLERFREAGDAVLLGTTSFWEGVDVRGNALSCVIIDKLPFASPGDPVMQARIDAERRRGGNPFLAFQIPQAVIMLKQGVGRLIRDEADTGVLAICDPRLTGRHYGRIFLDSLPEMPVTRDLQVAEAFLRDSRNTVPGQGDAGGAQ